MQSWQYKGTQGLRIGSWPGSKYPNNPFIQIFCDSLTDSGLQIVNVSDPRYVRASEIDVLHIHWPEKVFWDGRSTHRIIARLVATIFALRRLHKSGVTLVWTVHNLKPHDLEPGFKPLWLLYLSQLCKLIDGFVTLSPSTVEVARREIRGLRQKPAIYAWHPAYHRTPLTSTQSQLRNDLGVDPNAHVYGFLGQVRPYKGVEELIGAFRGVAGDTYSLVIAGAATRARYARKLRRLVAGDERIKLILRSLSEEELSAFGSAANVLVLPFRDNLHSGSLVYAVSQHRTVLTPQTPFSTSLQEAVGGNWIQTYAPPLTPEILLSAKAAHGEPTLDVLSQSDSGRRVAEFYRCLVACRQERIPSGALTTKEDCC